MFKNIFPRSSRTIGTLNFPHRPGPEEILMMGRVRDTGSKITSKFNNLVHRARKIPRDSTHQFLCNFQPGAFPTSSRRFLHRACPFCLLCENRDFGLSRFSITNNSAISSIGSPLLDRCEEGQTRNFRIRNDLETSKVNFSFLVDSTRAREHNRTME